MQLSSQHNYSDFISRFPQKIIDVSIFLLLAHSIFPLLAGCDWYEPPSAVTCLEFSYQNPGHLLQIRPSYLTHFSLLFLPLCLSCVPCGLVGRITGENDGGRIKESRGLLNLGKTEQELFFIVMKKNKFSK